MLVHIGYHKTGTTWFQRRFFSGHPQLCVPFGYQEIVSALVYPHDLEFDPAAARAAFEPGLQAARERDRVPVISSERLSGNPHSGGYDSAAIARRLCATFPEARVWLVLRRQVDAIASNYRQYVREGGTGTLADYLRGDPPERVPTFRLAHFDYAPLVAHYQQLFGADRVRVSLYEDFRRDPAAFVAGVCAFVAIDASLAPTGYTEQVNESFSDLSVTLLRPSNLFSRYPGMGQYPLVNLPGRKAVRKLLTVGDGLGAHRLMRNHYKTRVRALVGETFKEPNRRLETLLGVDLAARGYDL